MAFGAIFADVSQFLIATRDDMNVLSAIAAAESINLIIGGRMVKWGTGKASSWFAQSNLPSRGPEPRLCHKSLAFYTLRSAWRDEWGALCIGARRPGIAAFSKRNAAHAQGYSARR
jgi:hypothetical protein